MKLTSDRVLRALARFDSASYIDVAAAVGRDTENERRSVLRILEGLAAEGFASRSGERGWARYAVTEAGRMKLREAA